MHQKYYVRASAYVVDLVIMVLNLFKLLPKFKVDFASKNWGNLMITSVLLVLLMTVILLLFLSWLKKGGEKLFSITIGLSFIVLSLIIFVNGVLNYGTMGVMSGYAQWLIILGYLLSMEKVKY